MATLYRAYRPQNFKEIVNQNHIKITLAHEIETGRLAHAYLFAGPRGIGKTTVARIFAKAINCEERKEGEHEPCDKCPACREFLDGRSMDVIEVDAASHTGVDNVRENIISVARMAPSRSQYRVFIIDEVHMLSISAFNALLKLLEEPPKNTLFILCTTEAHKIPDTIISRTERFDFKRISAKDIVKKLQYIITKEGISVENGILENIARQSGGHMRDAESLLGQVVAIGGKEVSKAEADLVIPRSDLDEVLNLLDQLVKKDSGSAIELLNRVLDDGIDLKRFLKETLELLRKLMLMKINPSLAERLGLDLGESLEIRATTIASGLELPLIIRMIERLLRVQVEIKGSFIEHLPLEIAMVELCLPEPDIRVNPVQRESVPMPMRNASTRPTTPVPALATNHNVSTNASPAPSSEPMSKIDLSKEAIFSRWSEVLSRVKSHNHSLSFILRACQPAEINGNQLCLAFKYKFHKDRINEVNIRQVIEKVLQEVYGHVITIEAVVDEELRVDENLGIVSSTSASSSEIATATDTPRGTAPVGKNDEDMLNNVLKAFGGKVV
jgi:DNA polymerase-3 subunit gamma/tau